MTTSQSYQNTHVGLSWSPGSPGGRCWDAASSTRLGSLRDSGRAGLGSRSLDRVLVLRLSVLQVPPVPSGGTAVQLGPRQLLHQAAEGLQLGPELEVLLLQPADGCC